MALGPPAEFYKDGRPPLGSFWFALGSVWVIEAVCRVWRLILDLFFYPVGLPLGALRVRAAMERRP